MRCVKCAGCIIEGLEERFCINCGARPDNVPYPEIMRDPYDRLHCADCKEPPMRGHQRCQRHLDAMRDYNRRKKALA